MNRQRHTNVTGTRPRPAGPTASTIGCLLGIVIVLLTLFMPSDVYSDATSAKYKEYEVKAAFIFNFLKFIDWPQEKTAGNNSQIVIGIIGEDPFGPGADIFKDKSIEEHKLLVKRFEGIEQIKKMPEKDRNEQMEALKRCHLLFICQSEQKQVRDIIEIVRNSSVLTVADADGFIEAGGIINFFTEDNKIRFDINQGAAEKTGLKIRSQLLRLAKRVVTESPAAKNAAKQEGN
ncbi:MAG: YfiR family protein [Sedimentisphaerales bacterium]